MRTPAQIGTGSGARHALVRRGAIDRAGRDQPLEVGGVFVERAELGDRPPLRGDDRAFARQRRAERRR